MYKKRCCCVFLIILFLGVVSGCRIRREQPLFHSSGNDSSIDVIIEKAQVEIGSVDTKDGLNGMADVTITMPDMLKVYEYLSSRKVAFSEVSQEKINRFVDNHSDEERYMCEISVYTEVFFNGEEWQLASNDVIREEARRQAVQIAGDRLNKVEQVEIVTEGTVEWEEG